MGKSPSIQDLEAKENDFRAYLAQLEQELAQKSANVGAQMATTISAFYTNNNYTDAKDIVSGQNYDFMHSSEFSLDNMKAIIDAISKAVFAGAPAPSGATVSSEGTGAVASGLGPEVGAIENLELYIAGQVFDVLSNVILSFGTSTEVTFNTNLQSKPLGYGMQMFTAVSADSYKSTSFFNDEYIYEYLYMYDVKFSLQQSKAEAAQTLVELYQDQIAAFKQREEDLLSKLEQGTLDPAAYTTTNAAYDTLIATATAKLSQLDQAARQVRVAKALLARSA
jgi:hypothetical protein